jgi:hypothetical protein
MRDLQYDSYISKEASSFVRDTIDRVYLEDNYHCCTTTEYEIWHIGDCCFHDCGCDDADGRGQKVFCGDFWKHKKRINLIMHGNDFLHILNTKGAASCVIEARRAYIVWGHGNRIYDVVIPEHLKHELICAAKAQGLYSRPPVLGIYVNNKISA